MLIPSARGIELSVKIIPHSQQKKIVGWEGENLKIRLHAPPEKNKANEELIELFSTLFHIPKTHVLILKGKTARHKRLLFVGLQLDEAKILLSNFLKSE